MKSRAQILVTALGLTALVLAAAVQVPAQVRPTRPGRPGTTPQTGAPGTATAPGADTSASRGFVPEGIDLLAGVDLSTSAFVLGDLSDLRGAVYDPETKQLVLLGKKSRSLPPFRLDDLAVALRAAQKLASGDPTARTPGVSIEGPIVDGMMTVRYLGGTENTHFGAVMFEADRLMKCLAMGRDNVTGKPLLPRVPGYRSELQLLHDLGGTRRPHAWHRYWFRPARVVVSESLDGLSMRFEQVAVAVETEYVPPLAPGQSEPAAEAFAKHMSENFERYAEEYPVFAELLSLAKLQGLVNWLVEKRVPIDDTGLLLAPVPHVPTPAVTPLGFAESEHNVPQGILKHQMRGGVDLRVLARGVPGRHKRNWYVSRSPVVTEMGLSVLEARKKGATRWQVSISGEPQVAVGVNQSVLKKAVEGARKLLAAQAAQRDRPGPANPAARDSARPEAPAAP